MHTIRIEGASSDCEAEIIPLGSSDAGVELFTFKWSSAKARKPGAIKLHWDHPLLDIAGRWTPSAGSNRSLPPDWAAAGTVRSMATRDAPVQCFHSLDGRNRLTIAASDALNVLELNAGVHEESATLKCSLNLFSDAGPPIDRYEVTLRIDTRDVPFYESLRDIGAWWAEQPQYTPSASPEVSRRPMYSTWYSFHQNLDVNEVVDECQRARALGCEAVIVDDGWQTTDASRGYSFCGDWQPERIPQMRGFVDAVHATGMKFLLWYAVPFVGKNSTAFTKFEGKFLRFDESMGAGVLDPRFPEVRDYLITLYERHLREWDLDGFKLDFVDEFKPSPVTGDGRDTDSVPAAADRLLSDVMTRLRAIKPDIIIEFRQWYVGPLMRKYGNMFRAADCPNDFVLNRLRTIDLRLLAGNTAVHADMIMWHSDEPVESAALQLVQILFSVPQISVRLDRIPPAHAEMLRFWLGFWNEHRAVLLDGTFEPLSPAALYPVVRASKGDTSVVCLFDDAVGVLEAIPREVHIVNGTRAGRVIVEALTDGGQRQVRVRDCTGRDIEAYTLHLSEGVHALRIPPAGTASLIVGP